MIKYSKARKCVLLSINFKINNSLGKINSKFGTEQRMNNIEDKSIENIQLMHREENNGRHNSEYEIYETQWKN